MTDERDFDRISRAWLDLMPDEAPDRMIAAVLQAVETMPQARQPLRSALRRFPPMPRLYLAAAMAAALVIVGSVLLFGRWGGPSVATSPAISPSSDSAVQSSSPASPIPVRVWGPTPSDLHGRWIGGHRPVPQIADGAGMTIVLTGATFAMTQSNDSSTDLLGSAAAATSDGFLRLEATSGGTTCHDGDIGTYSWLLSPDAKTLTIAKESDVCQVRGEAVPGTWWLVGCKDPGTFCLGDVAPGTYSSQYVAPRLAIGAPWLPVFGALTYTVPAGWANSSDWPSTFSLTPSSAYASSCTDANCTADAPNWDAGQIFVFVHPSPLSERDRCMGDVNSTADQSIGTMLGSIRQIPGLNSSTVQALTIDGRPGQWIDLRPGSSWVGCPGRASYVAFKTSVGSGFGGLGVAAGERQRLILVDIGNGDVLGILVHARDQARFDDLVAQAMPIIDSFKFK
jgi:hypothetical protein